MTLSFGETRSKEKGSGISLKCAVVYYIPDTPVNKWLLKPPCLLRSLPIHLISPCALNRGNAILPNTFSFPEWKREIKALLP